MIFAHDLVLPSEGEGAMKPSGIWNLEHACLACW